MNIDVRDVAARILNIYETSRNPARDIAESAIVQAAYRQWDNAHELIEKVRAKAFERIGKDIFFTDYLLHSIEAQIQGIDNGFREGSYIHWRFIPYIESYMMELEQRFPGWDWITLPWQECVLECDMIAQQAWWQYTHAVPSGKKSNEWFLTETFIYDLYDKDNHAKERRNIRRLIDKHFIRHEGWFLLPDRKHWKPSIRRMFQTV